MNEVLFKYEENYFNCRNAQFVSYLRAKGVPVDFYFYNTFENTKTVFDHLFTHNQNRWLFNTSCLSDIKDYTILGVKFVDLKFSKYQSAKDSIVRLLGEGNSVFLWLCNYYIPHREHYQRYRSFHSFIIHDLAPGREFKYVVQDPPEFYGEMSEEIVSKAFNATAGIIRGITYADTRFLQVDKSMLMDNYTQWLKGFSDDFSTYKKLKELIPDRLFVDLEEFTFFFAILFGSRLLFSRFLEAMSFDQALVNIAAESSNLAESIHRMLKYHTNREEIDSDRILSMITDIAEKERYLIGALKISL